MSINNLSDLMLAIEAYMNTYPGLSYVNTFQIRKYNINSLPNFETYCIIISPASRREKNIALRTKIKTLTIDVVCIVRNFDPLLSLVGQATGETGIIKLIEDTEKALLDFGSANKNELTILYNEMDEAVNFNQHKFPERDDFYHEVILPYRVKLKPKTVEV